MQYIIFYKKKDSSSISFREEVLSSIQIMLGDDLFFEERLEEVAKDILAYPYIFMNYKLIDFVYIDFTEIL